MSADLTMTPLRTAGPLHHDERGFDPKATRPLGSQSLGRFSVRDAVDDDVAEVDDEDSRDTLRIPRVAVDVTCAPPHVPRTANTRRRLIRRVLATAFVGVTLCGTLAVLAATEGGTLSVEVDGRPLGVDANVYVDGELRCESIPCVVAGMKAGGTVVRVKAPGFEEKVVFPKLENGETTEVEVALKRSAPPRR